MTLFAISCNCGASFHCPTAASAKGGTSRVVKAKMGRCPPCAGRSGRCRRRWWLPTPLLPRLATPICPSLLTREGSGWTVYEEVCRPTLLGMSVRWKVPRSTFAPRSGRAMEEERGGALIIHTRTNTRTTHTNTDCVCSFFFFGLRPLVSLKPLYARHSEHHQGKKKRWAFFFRIQ